MKLRSLAIITMMLFVLSGFAWADGKDKHHPQKRDGNVEQKVNVNQKQKQQQQQTQSQSTYVEGDTIDIDVDAGGDRGSGVTIPESTGRDFTTGAPIPIPQAPQPTLTGQRPWNVFDNMYIIFGDKRTVFDFEINKVDLSGTEAITDAWGEFLENGGPKYHNPVSSWKERDQILPDEWNYIATSTIKCESTVARCYFRMHKECQEKAGDIFEIVVKDHSTRPESGSWGIGGSISGATLSDSRSSSMLYGGGTGYSKAWVENVGTNQALIKIYRKKGGGQTPDDIRKAYRKHLEDALKKAQ